MSILDELSDVLLRAAAAMEGNGERIPLHHQMWVAHLRAEARAVRLLALSWRPADVYEPAGVSR